MKHRYPSRTVFAALLTLAGAVFPAEAWIHPAIAGAADASPTNEITSQKGLFRVGYESQVAPVPINQIHSWFLTIKHPDGTPVLGAKVAITGDMPIHGHRLPTKPRVTREIVDGTYLVEGMKFQMPGDWVVDFDISAAGAEDRAHFDLTLGGAMSPTSTHHHGGANTHEHGAGGMHEHGAATMPEHDADGIHGH